jgi:hypothetical protein
MFLLHMTILKCYSPIKSMHFQEDCNTWEWSYVTEVCCVLSLILSFLTFNDILKAWNTIL